MTPSPNKEAIRRFFEEAWREGKLEAVDVLYHPGFLDHDSHGATNGTASLKAAIASYRAQYPGLRFVIEDQIEENDVVVTRWRTEGPVQASGIRIDRFAGGRIVEEWEQWTLEKS